MKTFERKNCITMLGVSVLSILAASAVLAVQAEDIQITYSCSAGDVDINLGNLLHNVTYKAAVGAVSTVASSNCTQTLQAVPKNDSTISLSGCTSSEKLVLYLMEPQGTLENAVGVGRIYTFPIDCQAQNQTVKGNFSVDSTVTPIPLEPTITLNMSISPDPMYLGQEVNVTITETGSVKHLLNLMSCIASSSDNTQNITLVSDGGKQQPDLVKEITSGPGEVVMTLYGFRFMKDPNVQLTCTVKVCASSSTDCQSTTAVGKREIILVHPDSSSLHVVSGSFRVIPDQEPQ